MTLYAISVIANSSLNTMRHFQELEKNQGMRGARRMPRKMLEDMKTTAEIEAYDNLNLILTGKAEAIVEKANELMTKQHGQMAKEQKALTDSMTVDVDPLMETGEELAKKDYDKVIASGMFYEFHPELTGEWEKDKDAWMEKLRKIASQFEQGPQEAPKDGIS